MMSVERKEDMSPLGAPAPALRVTTPMHGDSYHLLDTVLTEIEQIGCRYRVRPANGYGTSFKGLAVQMQHEEADIDDTTTYKYFNKIIYITCFTPRDAHDLALKLVNRQSIYPLWGKCTQAMIETGMVQKCTSTGAPLSFAKDPSCTTKTTPATTPTYDSESEFPTLSKCHNEQDNIIRTALGTIGYNLRVTMGACNAQQEYDGIQQACAQMGLTVDQLRQYLRTWSDTATLVEKVKSWDVEANTPPAEASAPSEDVQKPREVIDPTSANKNERRALQPVNGDGVSPSLLNCPTMKNDNNDQKKQQISATVLPGLPMCQMLAQIRFELGAPSASLPDLEDRASSDVQYTCPIQGTGNAHQRVKMLYDYVCAH